MASPEKSQHLLNRGQTIFWQESSQLEPCHNTFLIEVKRGVNRLFRGRSDRSQHLLNRGQTIGIAAGVVAQEEYRHNTFLIEVKQHKRYALKMEPPCHNTFLIEVKLSRLIAETGGVYALSHNTFLIEVKTMDQLNSGSYQPLVTTPS